MKRIKGVFISIESANLSSGVKKKIDNQIRELSYHSDIRHIRITKKNVSAIVRMLSVFPFGSMMLDYNSTLKHIEEYEELDYVLIRGRALDRKYILFLKKLREQKTKTKILFELPTYPLNGDLFHSKTMWPWVFKNFCYRWALKQYVDRIVTYSEDEHIYGIQTIKIKNGIFVDDFLSQSNAATLKRRELDRIKLIAVAQFQKSHGYERIIRGLNAYYKKKNYLTKVILYMVGEGSTKKAYEKLVKKYKLEDKVIFCGKVLGDDLENMYRSVDIGLGSFAAYRQNIHISSELKIRDYLSCGLPVVSGIKEDVLSKDLDFYLEFPNDNSDVSIERIVDFYEALMCKYKKDELNALIHSFAKEKVDMSVTMKPVIDFITNK